MGRVWVWQDENAGGTSDLTETDLRCFVVPLLMAVFTHPKEVAQESTNIKEPWAKDLTHLTSETAGKPHLSKHINSVDNHHALVL